MRLPFKKYEGLKNDFIILDLRKVAQEAHRLQWESRDLHVALCERHRGIGADGVLVLSSAPGVRAKMTITNSDGSTPEMCGNGVRCVAQYLRDLEEVGPNETFAVGSDAGPKSVTLTPEGIRVGMGLGKRLKNAAGEILWGTAAKWCPESLPGTSPVNWAVDMGNPHLVLDLAADAQQIQVWGPAWEKHPHFTAGVNVGFSEVLEPNALALRVWERGAGATWACGTGACAAALARASQHRWEGPVSVRLPGGVLTVELQALGDGQTDVFMTGAARHVYSGEVPASVWKASLEDSLK